MNEEKHESNEEEASEVKQSEDADTEVELVANVIEASKDGDVVKYTIQSKETSASEENDERGHVVVREYDDFEWLDHCIRTQNDIDGVIVPPLHVKLHVTAQATENKTKKQLGNKTKSMLGDEFTNECRYLEKFIQLLLAHPKFCKDENLRKFLVDEELPARVKVKKGILNSWSKTVGEVRFHSYKDNDEDFQNKRDFVNKYSIELKSCSESFVRMVNSLHKVASDLGVFATTVSNAITDGTNTKQLNSLLSQFATCLEKSRESHNVIAINDERTFGFTASLYTIYLDSAKSMFLQRTQKLVKFENATKALEKSKPQNQKELEEAKKTAEREFNDISEKADKEFSRFQRQRVLSFQSSLVRFTEAQISNARDTYAIMAKLSSDIKAI